jgi:hypothetical protein
MPDIDLIDKSLDRANTQNYHLSIQADLNGFSFCILDIKRRTYIGLRHYQFEKVYSIDDYTDKLTAVLNEDKLIDLQYKSSSFVYLTQKSTLIPESFFDKSNLKAYFQFNQSLNELDEIHYNFLSEINAYNIFAIPNYIVNEIVSHIENIILFHQATPFIKIIVKRGIDKENKCVYVNMNNKFIDIAVAARHSLFLYNTFQFQNENDLLYFILYIYKQLNLDTKKNKLLITGEQSDNIKYHNALKKYITTVKYLEPIKFLFSGVFTKINKHKFLNLFNLVNCA